ncbi:hypothetical protein BN1051_01312 [Arthrobacter saudimassiliensis]|uniref:Uncharacterized protein n=1 Tax=Arthrobacter saudimassiliensis TaxID=1461584 RepID=A0A078MKY2_9MICC|nr:hypothetical protein BN1051_01312 [Arthrobacter saudimassiliensis]
MGANATERHLEASNEKAANSGEPNTHASIHDETIGHGNTPAAWTCVLIMIVGAGISSVGYIIASVLWFVIGLAVMGAGLIVGWAMKKAGYGVNGSKLKNSGH